MKILTKKMGSTLLVVANFLCCLAVNSGDLYANSENKAEKIEQMIEDTATILQTLAQHEIDASAL